MGENGPVGVVVEKMLWKIEGGSESRLPLAYISLATFLGPS